MKRFLILCTVLVWASASAADPDLTWSSLYDGGAQFDDSGVRVVKLLGGDTVVAGVSHDGVLGSDIVVRRLAEADGGESWLVRLPAFDDSDMAVADLFVDGAGDLLVIGYIQGCVG